MLGLYVSYNEEKHGSIDEPLRISNSGYLIFQSRKSCKKEFNFPTKILLRISKKGDFYLGELHDVKDYIECDPKIFEDTRHRPMRWIEMDKNHEWRGKSVFFISNLTSIEEPLDLQGKHPPETFYYRDF